MPSAQLAGVVPSPIRDGIQRLRASLHIPDAFSAEVEAEAARAASAVVLPELDRTDLAFVTIDPEGATDLDQALCLERDGDGYVVWYAIADLASFVTPGGAVDREAHARGVTLYSPAGRTPLHPPVLSEDAASLLAGQVRPALLWEHRLDARGERVSSRVRRARVRNREQLSYAGVQASLDAGTAPESLMLLREVGRLREALEAERGGVSLPIPAQEVEVAGDCWELVLRSILPVEGWNAQMSLLTGMAAAELMLGAKIGVVRTLPPAPADGVARLRRIARGLRISWPASMGYPEFVRSLDAAHPQHLAMLNACTSLFRGAGYAAFDGELPEQPLHGAMNAAYAHCTAPIRRLADRYAGEICVAICAGRPVPDWVRAALPALPATMEGDLRRSNAYERGIVGLVEALALSGRIGETFRGTVVDWRDSGRGEVQLESPAVTAPLVGGTPALGAEIDVVLIKADLTTGEVEFVPEVVAELGIDPDGE
ncbi:MAG: RNB domain-containing ribonuclease [Propioniciclava sp.]|uniref:RNB domain-containing ribonuclease n=1 Tax=Propioniciclava sp. TaxID=2038686 RepID=UPI0039E22A27